MRDKPRSNEQTLKIELLSQWKLEAEFRNKKSLYCELKILTGVSAARAPQKKQAFKCRSVSG